MAQVPNSFILEALRKLAGGARVSYLDEDRAIKKVERLVKMPRNAWDIPFYTADVEHPTAILVQQVKAGEDQQFAEIYRVYETLPGELRYSISFPYGGLTGFPRLTIRQHVRADSQVFEAPGAACPIPTYGEAILITQAYADSDYPAVRVNTRVYDVIPTAGDQIGYGYSVTYPYGGLTAFPRITWSFQVDKDDYIAAAPGSACPIAGYTSAVLVSEQVQSSTEQSQLLTVTRIYDVIPAASAQQGFGYSVSFPYGGITTAPRITWNFQVANSGYAPAAPGSACPITGYTSAVLIAETTQGSGQQNQILQVSRVYDVIPSSTQQTGFGYSLSYPYGGLTSFPRITWRFKIAAGSYSTAALGSACPIAAFSTAVLVNQQMEGESDQNQIVSVVRTYDIIPLATDQQTFGYSLSYPYGGLTTSPRVTWRFQVTAGSYAAAAPGSACPITGYTAAKLVSEVTEGSNEQSQIISVTRTYDVIPTATQQQGFGYSLSYPYGGLSGFSRVTWRFKIALSAYAPVATGSTCPITGFTTAILVSQQMEASPEQSQVVEVVRTYDLVPVAADQQGLGYSLSYPYGGLTGNPRVTWRFKIAKGVYSATAPGTTCPIAGYLTAVLISEKTESSEEQDQVITVARIYDLIPTATQQQGFGYSLGYTGGDKDFPFLTWRFTVARSAYASVGDLSACPITGYTALKVTDQKMTGDDEQSLEVTVEIRYETLPGPLMHSVKYENDDPLFPIVTTKQRVALGSYTPGTINVDTCPATGYETLLLHKQSIEPTEQNNVKEDTRSYYTIPGPQKYGISYPYGLTANPRITVSVDMAKATYAPLAYGAACTITGFTTAVLVAQKADPIEEHGGGLLRVERVYDIIPVAANQQGLGYSITYGNGDKDYPIITWKFTMALASYAAANDLSACPITGFTSLVLTDQKVTGSNEQNQTIAVERTFETLPGPTMHSVEYQNDDPLFPIVTTKQRVSAGAYTPGVINTDTCPVPGYVTLVLHKQDVKPTEQNNVKEDTRSYYVIPGPQQYAISYPYGLTAFPRVTVTLDMAKASYAPLAYGALCTVTGFTTAVLVAQKADPILEHAGGLLKVERVYDVIPAAANQQGLGYSISYGNGDKDYPTITWKFTMARASYAAANDLSACPITGFTTLVLTDQKVTGSNEQDQTVMVERTFETLPGPTMHSVEYQNDDPAFPVVTTKQRVSVSAYTPGVINTDTCPVTGYTTLLLHRQTVKPTEQNNVKEDTRSYYVIPGPQQYALSYPYGLTTFPRITVTLDIAKASYAPLAFGTACTVTGFTTAVLIAQKADPILEHAGGLLKVERIYDIIPAAADQQGLGYSLEYINGDKDYPALTWKFTLARSSYATVADLSACPITGFTGLLCTDQKMVGSNEQNQTVEVERKYETLPGPTMHSVEYQNDDAAFPVVTTKQRVSAGSYTPGVINVETCPVPGYTTLLLHRQSVKPTDQNNVKEDTRSYYVIPGPQQHALSYPYGGLTAFPRVTVTLDIAKASYTPLAPGTLCTVTGFTTAVLVSQKADPIQEHAGGLFKVTRVYDVIPVAVDQDDFGYDVSYPYGLTTAPRVTWKFSMARASYAAAALGSASPIPGYTTALLINEKMKGSTEQSLTVEVTRTYDVVPAAADQQGFGYSLSYTNGDKDYPALTWAFEISLSAYAAVADLSACPITGFTALLCVEQQMKGNNDQPQTVTVTRKYETLPGPLGYEVDYDNNQITFPIVTTKQRVALSAYAAGTEGTTTCPITGYTTLVLFEQHANPTEYANVKEDARIYEKNPNNTLTTSDFDADLSQWITTTRQKIAAGTNYTADKETLEIKQTAIDRWRTIQVVARITAVPPQRTEYKTGQWPFPELLSAISVAGYRMGDGFYQSALGWNQRPRYECSITPTWLRQLKNVQALFRITTSFHFLSLGLPAISLYTAPTRDVFYSGVIFRFDFRNVLCNTVGPNISFSGVGDAKYGDMVESVTFSATNPSATTYYNMIGDWKIVGVEQEKYRGDLWVQQKTEVLLQ